MSFEQPGADVCYLVMELSALVTFRFQMNAIAELPFGGYRTVHSVLLFLELTTSEDEPPNSRTYCVVNLHCSCK